MTIASIIKMCENVKPNDNVLVVFKYADTDSVQKVHMLKTAKEWCKHDIMISLGEHITFKVLSGALIIKVSYINLR